MIGSMIFKKSLALSFVGHFAFFSIISLSFGKRIPGAQDYAPISFWGDLQISAVSYNLAKGSINNIKIIRDFFSYRSQTGAIQKVQEQAFPIPSGYIRPALASGFGIEKSVFVMKAAPERFVRKSSEPSIVFHPVLPYDFTLYFKDRQVAHVELMFDIVSSAGRNSIDIRRKITSGNPEVDLLIMRNISHYLSMQQARFSPNSWQTVKIDLSGKR